MNVSRIHGLLVAFAFASAARAQTTVGLPGTAVDLAATSAGKLLVATGQGDVLEVDTAGGTLTLAAPGQFVRPLVACVSLAPGVAAVLDDTGSIFEVGSVPGTPILRYADAFLIREPTDLVLDTNGNFWIPCKTVSNNTRSVAHVSADGSRWGYFDVTRSPLAGAHDPLTGALLLTDAAGAIEVLTVDADGAPINTVLVSASGMSVAALDGDVAIAADGDVYYSAGAVVKLLSRASLTTSNFASFASTVRGVAFAPASGGIGDSLWIVEGSPSTLREVPATEIGGPLLGPALADVPGTGTQVLSYTYNVNETIVDRDGHLLIGGDSFGANVRVDRIALPGVTLSNVATGAMGLSSRIEGLAVARDGRIHALTRFGAVHAIDESGPTVVSTPFSDPLDRVVTGKDLELARNGDMFVADRKGWDFGSIARITPSGAYSDLCLVEEARGVHVDPFGARLLATEWNNTGFNGAVGVVNAGAGTLDDLPGFAAFNMSNQENFGDGDMVVDVTGRVYTSALDEFSVVVWNPATQRKKRLASGYLNNVGGLAIARSSTGANSSTGFSLYVSQWNRLHEIPGVPPAAPRAFDEDAPGIGRVLGWTRPEWGRPLAFVHEPLLGALVVVTDLPAVVEFPLDGSTPSVLCDNGLGSSGDLCAVAARANGDLLVGTTSGDVLLLDASNGYTPSTWFADVLDEIDELSDLVHDDTLGTWLLEAAPTPAQSAPLWHLVGGVLTRVAEPWNGAALAFDPLTADLFVAQAASPTSGGEVLRLHTGSTPMRVNHWPSERYESFAFDGLSRGLAPDGDGNLYAACDASGRIALVARSNGAVTVPAGNYDTPIDAVVAPGRPGVAGVQGASLFVLDGCAIFEHGIAGPVPSAPVPALEVDPFTAPALFQFGGGNTLELVSPADAGLPFLVLPGVSGQLTPLPLASITGDLSDTRTLPQEFDLLWFNAINGTPPFVNWLNFFDGAGVPVAPLTFDLPNALPYTGYDFLVDLMWVSLDPFAPSGVRTVGGTSQIRVGL